MSSEKHNWRLFLASATGTAHIARGRPCDDSGIFFEVPNGSWLAVVADGAGSAKYAANGSEVAVREASHFMRERLSEAAPLDEESFHVTMRACLLHTRDAISKAADAQGASIADLATTIIMVCVTPHLVAALQIGDGGIAIRRGNGEVFLFFRPNRGEYVNETNFITSSDFLDRARIGVMHRADIIGIAAFTDGIEFLAVDFAKCLPHAPFFQPLFDFAASADAKSEDLEEFLASKPVCDRTDDDKTLLLAVLA